MPATPEHPQTPNMIAAAAGHNAAVGQVIALAGHFQQESA
jgi:hypothetical protein